MDDLKNLRDRLAHRRMGKIVEHTNLHPNTIRAVINGSKRQSYDTVLKLSAYLEAYP